MQKYSFYSECATVADDLTLFLKKRYSMIRKEIKLIICNKSIEFCFLYYNLFLILISCCNFFRDFFAYSKIMIYLCIPLNKLFYILKYIHEKFFTKLFLYFACD